MTVVIVLICIAILIVLISVYKVHAFLSFLVVSLIAGLGLGLPLPQVAVAVQKGMGDVLGSLLIIITTGAMLGKIVAESGAAQKIAKVMMTVFGRQHIQWAMVITGFIVGIPLYYGIGFVLLVPLIFSIVYRYQLNAVFIGLPMLAALSVTHGFLPPHPSPAALVVQFGADMSLTLWYGLIVSIPAIVMGGPLLSKTFRHIQAAPLKSFQIKEKPEDQLPGTFISVFTALLPVILLALTPMLPLHLRPDPSIVMLLALLTATFTLGTQSGRSLSQVMDYYADAVKDIAGILLIIAGSGALKEVLVRTGVSDEVAIYLQGLPLHPLVLSWLMAAIIRFCVGSATIAGLTTAGIVLPLMMATGTNPNLMVLAVGAGSLMFSHVNDAGFWLFKEYFNLSMKDTFRTWAVMESVVGSVGLVAILIVNSFI